MRILSVDLDNIKSYRRTRIDLTAGLNAISGHNGSGKTTILEAIGFALFDHLPYNHAAFVREGEKTGTVRVSILAPDEREYEVVRKVGSSSQYYVADVESGAKLAERGAAVRQWVRTHALGIDGDADLSALFVNAVGVPQGKMTSDFMGTGNTRKPVFDPLLRVEEYQRAWSALRDAASNLKDRVAAVREEIAKLSTDVEKIPAVEEEAAAEREQVAESERTLRALQTELEETEQRKRDLDARQARVLAREQELQAREYDRRRYADLLGARREQLENAQAARRLVEEARPGFDLYAAAQQELEALAAEERQRDDLKRKADIAQHGMINEQNAITRLDKDRAQAIQDQEEATALTPKVERQQALEKEQTEAEMAERDARRLEAEIERASKEIRHLEEAGPRRAERLTSARKALEETARIPQLEQEQQETVRGLAAIGSLREQLRETEDEGKHLRLEHDALTEQVQRWETVTATLAGRRAVADGLGALEHCERELREERIRIRAELDYQKVARAELERERCPLLELRCPVVAADGETLERFDGRLARLADRLQELEGQIEDVEPRLALARDAVLETQTLSVEAARLEGSPSRLETVAADLERCRARYSELAKTMATEQELKERDSRLSAELVHLRERQKLAGQIPVMEEQQREDEARLAERRGELCRLQEAHAALEGATQRLEAVRGELRELDDPRGRQQRLFGTAGGLGELERRLAEHQRSLQDHSDRARVLVAELRAFEGLDERIAAQKALRTAHQAAYEQYLQNEHESGEVEARQAAVQEAEQAVHTAEEAVASARRGLEEATAAYDAAMHEITNLRFEELQKECGGAESSLRHQEEELVRIEEELARCRRQEERLRAEEAELGSLGRTDVALKFVRETIRQAGPTITETLLANISQIANDIYADIMDDHAVELRWDREYEILVRRGPDDRKFAQLSGGEQMSAALAVRLALLKEMSEVCIAFFDEPTQNMDADRRVNLADQIRHVRGFEQLVVISHDDTFEHHTDNLIRLEKDEDETQVVG